MLDLKYSGLLSNLETLARKIEEVKQEVSIHYPTSGVVTPRPDWMVKLDRLVSFANKLIQQVAERWCISESKFEITFTNLETLARKIEEVKQEVSIHYPTSGVVTPRPDWMVKLDSLLNFANKLIQPGFDTKPYIPKDWGDQKDPDIGS